VAASDEKAGEDADFIPLESTSAKEEIFDAEDEEEEEMSAFMQEYFTHKEQNSQQQGGCDDEFHSIKPDPELNKNLLEELARKPQRMQYRRMRAFREKLPAFAMEKVCNINVTMWDPWVLIIVLFVGNCGSSGSESSCRDKWRHRVWQDNTGYVVACSNGKC
jgi:hypothetical protein